MSDPAPRYRIMPRDRTINLTFEITQTPKAQAALARLFPETITCAHCGKTASEYAGGCDIPGYDRWVDFCHPEDGDEPDCYTMIMNRAKL